MPKIRNHLNIKLLIYRKKQVILLIKLIIKNNCNNITIFDSEICNMLVCTVLNNKAVCSIYVIIFDSVTICNLNYNVH